MKSILYSLISFTTAVLSQSEDDKLKYPEFTRFMHHWGYSWEAFTLTTEDAYILTTFHITGREGHKVEPDPALNPVLMMHGQGCDATSWVDPSWGQYELPLPL